MHYKYEQEKLTDKQQISDSIIFSNLVQVWGHSDNIGRRVRNLSLGESACQIKLICLLKFWMVMEEFYSHNI